MLKLVKQAEYEMDLTQNEVTLFATLMGYLSPAQCMQIVPDMGIEEVDSLYEKLKDHVLHSLNRITVSTQADYDGPDVS